MRLNVYAEELPPSMADDAVERVSTTVLREDGERTFFGARLYLKSHPDIHHTTDDDDRSAITIWGPREQVAVLLRRMADQVSNEKSPNERLLWLVNTLDWLRNDGCPSCDYDEAEGGLVNHCDACCRKIAMAVCRLDIEGGRDPLANLRAAVEFYDRVCQASVDEQIAVGQDHHERVISAAREAVGRPEVDA